MIQFEQARKLYQGTKRGYETELKDFCKHKDWEKVISLLLPAIQTQIKVRQAMKKRGEFVPAWKNFKTWLNQRCWEEEYPQADKEPRQPEPKPPTIYKDGVPQLASKEFKDKLMDGFKKEFLRKHK